jgi:hypothetical protein
MCPSEHEAGIKLELKQNCSSHIRVLFSKTYSYPKGEHIYASSYNVNINQRKRSKKIPYFYKNSY